MEQSLITGLFATAGLAIGAGAVVWHRARKVKKAPASQTIQVVPDVSEQRAREGKFDPEATRIFSASMPPLNARPMTRQGGFVLGAAEARLVGLSGHHKGRSFDISGNGRGLFLGRQPACDIQLEDRRVSGRHAWIGIIDGKAILRDLKSTNGTFVNAKMDAPIHQVELHPGDMVVLGGHGGAQFHLIVKDKALWAKTVGTESA